MKLNIDPKIFEQHQDLKIGVILIKGMSNTRRISDIESLLRGITAQRSKEFATKEINNEHSIQVWHQAYGKFGINPNKYSPSISALLNQVKSGKELPNINSLVDLYNYFSLKYLLPIGGKDMDWLSGDLNLTFTKGGEPFRPLGAIEIERAKEGEVSYMDNGGITSRYWNHRDCERTKFTKKTVNAAIIIEDLTKMHMDQFGTVLKDIQNTIIRYIGGQIEPYILNEEQPSVDLGIKGRTHADDSKVPQQEKAHFVGQQNSVTSIASDIKIENKEPATQVQQNTTPEPQLHQMYNNKPTDELSLKPTTLDSEQIDTSSEQPSTQQPESPTHTQDSSQGGGQMSLIQ